MNWETILCVGDSITIGSRSYLGYPEYCGSFLSIETNKKWNVINHATAGYTAIDLARSIDNAVTDIKTSRPDIATVLIGTNDLKSNTSVRKFKLAYEFLLIKLRLIVGTDNLILLEIPNLMHNVMLPYNIKMNDLVSSYNEILKQLAEENGFYCLKLKCEDSFFFDGVHLNEFGSEKIGKQISDYILKLRR